MTDYRGAIGDAGQESERLAHLSEISDPHTFSVFERLEIGPGWKCWEAGAGTGAVSAWLADRVGDSGTVWSTDVELEHHQKCGANVTVEAHDLVSGKFPADAFDLIHVRSVLRHIPERVDVLKKFAGALRPGGYLVVEDMDMSGFVVQPLPEPYAGFHRLIAGGVYDSWRDTNFGMKVLDLMRESGLVDLDARGRAWTMHPHESSGDWWFRIIDRALPVLARARLANESEVKTAIAQIQHPDFVMLSPLWITTVGRRAS